MLKLDIPRVNLSLLEYDFARIQDEIVDWDEEIEKLRGKILNSVPKDVNLDSDAYSVQNCRFNYIQREIAKTHAYVLWIIRKTNDFEQNNKKLKQVCCILRVKAGSMITYLEEVERSVVICHLKFASLYSTLQCTNTKSRN